jgi:manganese-transporting P-type ATPase
MDYIYRHIARPYLTPTDNNDEKFQPTVFNTVIFIYNLFNQTCIFLFNYGGLPFMRPLTENKSYFKWLIVPFILSYVLLANEFEQLNSLFGLKFDGFPEHERQHLMHILCVVGFLNWGVERALKYLKYGEWLDHV